MTRARGSVLARLYRPPPDAGGVRALYARRARAAANPGPRMSLGEFVREAWREIEPAPLAWGWHLEAQCDHAEAVTRGEIKRLLVNVPPGSSKSLIWAVFWPAWEWTLAPWRRWLIVSVSEDALVRDARRFRALVGSQWYASRWPRVVARDDETATNAMGNTAGGKRYTRPMQGALTSLRGDRLVIDDPQSVHETLYSLAYRKGIVERVQGEALSRVNDEKTSPVVVVQQRIHEGDVTGALLAGDGWERCSIPMQRTDDDEACFVPASGWDADPRAVGEYMHPERFGAAEALSWQTSRPRHWQSQMQQRPTRDDEATFIRREWLQTWRPSQLPRRFTRIVTSWDLTLGKARKDVERGEREGRRSYVVGQVWGEHAGHYYLLDQVRGRWGADEQSPLILRVGRTAVLEALRGERPQIEVPTQHLIEDTVLGPRAEADLRSLLPGVVLVPVDGLSKEARVDDVLGLFAAKSVWVPPADLCPWVTGYIERVTAFPSAEPDDEVDATSQALRGLRGTKSAWFDSLMGAKSQAP